MQNPSPPFASSPAYVGIWLVGNDLSGYSKCICKLWLHVTRIFLQKFFKFFLFNFFWLFRMFFILEIEISTLKSLKPVLTCTRNSIFAQNRTKETVPQIFSNDIAFTIVFWGYITRLSTITMYYSMF